MGVSVLSVGRQQCLDGDEIKSIGLAGTDRIGSPSQLHIWSWGSQFLPSFRNLGGGPLKALERDHLGAVF
jgi:hypothetical protein